MLPFAQARLPHYGHFKAGAFRTYKPWFLPQMKYEPPNIVLATCEHFCFSLDGNNLGFRSGEHIEGSTEEDSLRTFAEEGRNGRETYDSSVMGNGQPCPQPQASKELQWFIPSFPPALQEYLGRPRKPTHGTSPSGCRGAGVCQVWWGFSSTLASTSCQHQQSHIGPSSIALSAVRAKQRKGSL